MAEELEQLKALRGIPKGLVTKMTTWVTERGVTATSFELDVKLDQLKKYELQFEKVQSDLELKDPVERAPEAEERSTFEDRVASLKAQLMQLRAQHQDPLFHDTSLGNINVDISGSELPKFDIPSFSGDYKQFPHFLESFNALVHNSKARGLTDVKKLAILRTSLSGRAFEAIKDLPMGADSYQEALAILKERFENKRLIFDAYVKNIWEFTRASDTTTLRHLCDSASATMRGLRLLGSNEEIANGIITHLILTKCDSETVKKWEEKSAKQSELIKETEFMDFLKKRCTQLESVEYALQSQPNSTSTPSKSNEKLETDLSYVNSSTTYEAICPVCDGHHILAQCDIFCSKTPEERYSMARVRDKCVRCLVSRRGHRCICVCDKCQGLHHTLLHFDTKNSMKSDNISLNSDQRNVHSQFSASTLMVTSRLPDAKITILPTALVLVGSVNGRNVLLRVLLDSGSQSNLITERAAKLLALPHYQLDCPLELRGVNSSVVSKVAIRAQIKSLHHDTNELVTLIVHRSLRQMHPIQPIDIQSWNIPKDLTLADPKFFMPQDVDIILGAGMVFKCLLSKKLNLGAGTPIIQKTLYGWIAVGEIFPHLSTTVMQSGDEQPAKDDKEDGN